MSDTDPMLDELMIETHATIEAVPTSHTERHQLRMGLRLFPSHPGHVAVQVRGYRGRSQFAYGHLSLNREQLILLRDYLSGLIAYRSAME